MQMQPHSRIKGNITMMTWIVVHTNANIMAIRHNWGKATIPSNSGSVRRGGIKNRGRPSWIRSSVRDRAPHQVSGRAHTGERGTRASTLIHPPRDCHPYRHPPPATRMATEHVHRRQAEATWRKAAQTWDAAVFRNNTASRTYARIAVELWRSLLMSPVLCSCTEDGGRAN